MLLLLSICGQSFGQTSGSQPVVANGQSSADEEDFGTGKTVVADPNMYNGGSGASDPSGVTGGNQSPSRSQVSNVESPPTQGAGDLGSGTPPSPVAVQNPPESVTPQQQQAAQLASAAAQAASQNDWAGAIKAITAAVNLNPNDAQLHQQEEALLKLAPKDILSRFNLGNAGQQAQDLIRSAQTDSALGGPEGVPTAGPGINLGQASQINPQQEANAAPKTAREWEAAQLQSAARKMGIGDLEAAKISLANVLHENPRDWTAHTLLAKILLNQPSPDYAGAKLEAESALGLHPNDSDMLDALASALIRLEKDENSIQEIRKYLSGVADENKRTADAYFMLSEAYRRAGLPGNALKDLSNAASYDPQQFQKLYDRALAAYDRRNDQKGQTGLAGHVGGFAIPVAALAMLLGLAIFLSAIRPRTPSLAAQGPAKYLGLNSAAAGLMVGQGGTVMARDLADRARGGWAPGVRLAKYLLQRLAGEGGMGEVWEAVDEVLNRRVALKRPTVKLNDRTWFLKEARTVAKLKHPNIVAIHDVQEDPEPFLVFEYVEGRTLADILKEKHSFSFGEALRCLKPVCQALSYAHECNVIHRDLKPSNIMIQRDGTVKVMDFGIARDIQHSSTITNTPMGTPCYMAPEMNVGIVSAAGDVYSLAVILYELLAGELPSPTNFRPITSWIPNMPSGIDELIAHGRERVHKQRIPSVADFLAGLEKLALAPKTVLVRSAGKIPIPRVTPSHGTA